MSHQFIRHNHAVNPLAPNRHGVTTIQQTTEAMLVIITYTYRGFKWTKVSTKVAFCVNTTGTGCNLATLGNFIHTVLWGKTHLLSKPSTEFHKKGQKLSPSLKSNFMARGYVRSGFFPTSQLTYGRRSNLYFFCKTPTSLHVQKHWNTLTLSICYLKWTHVRSQ